MKKILSLLILILLILSMPFYTFADIKTPHIVVEGQVFLLNNNGEKLFIIPPSYYAKVLNLDENYYYITYNGVNGKVNRNEVEAVGYHKVPPNSILPCAIAEEYKDFRVIALLEKPLTSSNIVVELPTTSAFSFLGEFPTDNGIWYYVKFDNYYGYLKKERTTLSTLDIPTFVPESDSNIIPETPKPNIKESLLNLFSSGYEMKIVIIIGLLIPSILIVFLVFRPKKTKKKKFYED